MRKVEEGDKHERVERESVSEGHQAHPAVREQQTRALDGGALSGGQAGNEPPSLLSSAERKKRVELLVIRGRVLALQRLNVSARLLRLGTVERLRELDALEELHIVSPELGDLLPRESAVLA